MRRFHIFIAAAALALLATPVLALDNAPNPDISVGTCIENGGTVEQPPGSAIRACCLDGIVAKGCYICDFKWENCVWDPAYGSRTQGTTPFDGTAGQTLSPDGGGATKPDQRIIDQVIAPLDAQPQMQILLPQPQPGGSEGKGGATAGKKKKLQVVKPLTLLSPVPLDCQIGGGAGLTPIYVFNSTDIVIAPGRQIGWRTAAGNQGALVLPVEFYPGKQMRVGGAPGAASCSAWLVPEQPQLLQ